MVQPITGSIQTTYTDSPFGDDKINQQLITAFENWNTISDEEVTNIKNSILEKNDLQERVKYTQIKMYPAKSDKSLSKPDQIKGTISLLEGREMAFYIFLKDLAIHVQRYPWSKYTNDKDKIQQACSDEGKPKYETKKTEINNIAEGLEYLWSAFNKGSGDIPFAEIKKKDKTYNIFRGFKGADGFTLSEFFPRTVGTCPECKECLSGDFLTIMTGQKKISIILQGRSITLQADNPEERVEINASEYHKLADHCGKGIEPDKIKKLKKIL